MVITDSVISITGIITYGVIEYDRMYIQAGYHYDRQLHDGVWVKDGK